MPAPSPRRKRQVEELSSVAFPQKKYVNNTSHDTVKSRQRGFEVWLNAALGIAPDHPTLCAFLHQPGAQVRATWEEAGPLGINFSKDLAVIATSPATQAAHPQIVPGLVLTTVQETPVAYLAYGDVITLLKTQPHPLTLVFGRPTSMAEVKVEIDQPAPLGITLLGDLTISGTTPEMQASHPQLVPGMTLVSVGGVTTAAMGEDAAVQKLRAAKRPLQLVS
jgi:hypothetical protein